MRNYYRWLLCRQENFGLEVKEERRLSADSQPYGNWLFEKVLSLATEDLEADERPEIQLEPINVDKMIDESNWRSK